MQETFIRWLSLLLTALFCTSCALSTATRSRPYSPSPPIVVEPESFVDEPGPVLSPAIAVARALARHPALAAAAQAQAVERGRLLQAGQWANPRLGLTVEDFAGSGTRQGIDHGETTLRLEQEFELGGKRAARFDEAERAIDVAAWDIVVLRTQIRAQTLRTVVDALAAQNRLALADEVVTLDEKVVSAVERLVAAGRQHRADAQRAQAVLAAARIERVQAEAELVAARHRLAAHWGSPSADFERIEGDLMLDAGGNARSVDANPAVLQRQAEIAQRRAQLALEQTRAIPDLTLGGGLRHYGDGDDAALVFETSMPLPVRQRNRGAIAAAQARVAQAEAAAEATRQATQADLRQAELAWQAANLEAEMLQRDVVPMAHAAYAAMQSGHLEGRFRSSEVLDAQRAWIAARQRLYQAQAEHQRAAIEIQRLRGDLR